MPMEYPPAQTGQETAVRFANSDDLAFVHQDGHIGAEMAKRKIEWGEVVVAERQGARVGYARLEYLWSRLPYLALIYVLPEQRNGGVGRALLGYLESLARGQGHEVLYSSSQLDESAAQAWHRHMGFVECGLIAGVNRGGVGEVFFRKRLV